MNIYRGEIDRKKVRCRSVHFYNGKQIHKTAQVLKYK